MIIRQIVQYNCKNIEEQKNVRYKQILEVLHGKQMTAKEIAVELYNKGLINDTDRNYTAPRLTELKHMGKVIVVNKKTCQWTGKQVAVYSSSILSFSKIK